ncbi:hypothetical protein Tco_1435841, partial [Tanacetum coccineum]
AIFYARVAYKLRRELLQTKFRLKPQERTVNDKRKGGSIYNYEICGIDRQVATAPWPREEISSESTNLILTPWNILQCFLESTLQCGELEEDVMHAGNLLLNGKTISCSLRLSVLSIQFSQALVVPDILSVLLQTTEMGVS